MANGEEETPSGERMRARGTVLQGRVRSALLVKWQWQQATKKRKTRGTVINAYVFKGVQLPEKDGAATSTKKEIVDGTKVAAASIDY
jgi:hypothetical protein